MNNPGQNALLVDAGNSAVKWAQLGSAGLSEMVSKFYSDHNISPQFFIELWKDQPQPQQVIISCVADDLTWHAMQNACNELWGIEVNKVAAEKEAYDVINAYEDIASMGSDRWYAMIGARQLANGAYLVISAGSALTLDLVDANGVHQGGYIIPGLRMMQQSLGKGTAQVKTDEIENQPVSLKPGNSTTRCVKAGIYMAAVSFIQSVYEKEKSKTGTLHCYLCGGNAKVLAELLRFETKVVLNLVLLGLAQKVIELDVSN